ncbi:MAG: RNA polymerase sigma factor RpoD/SigA [Treponema sp.]|nr:RNA polymerase sigma factor RpoD/SigA [Treponema sp.]
MKRTDDDPGDDILQTYFSQIKSFPLLTFEEELELSKQIQAGDEAARNKLINANLRLVVKIAKAYIASDIAFLDLIQEGNMGLMHAAGRYDHLKNVRFSTYAGWWIRQFISRYLTNKRRVIRLPHRKEEILRKIHRSYQTLCQTLQHQPRTEEIARELDVSVEDINYILNMTNGLVSLNMDNGSSESSGMVEFHEDYTYSPEQALFRKISEDDTMVFLSRLKDRERRILMYRYQLDGGEHYTLKKIGDTLGISPETVRQIEMRALQKIRIHADELKNEAM